MSLGGKGFCVGQGGVRAAGGGHGAGPFAEQALANQALLDASCFMPHDGMKNYKESTMLKVLRGY